MARPSEDQSETVAAERHLNGEQYARVQNELNTVIALLRKTAEQQSDPKIADQFATAANQLTSLVDLLVRR
jgi:two-component sensor histidine kinase